MARRRGLAVHPDVAALPDDHFDAVTLWNVVDFFSQPVEQLRQIHRVLAPRGLVFVRTPNAAYQMAAWRLRRVLVWPPPVARLLTEAYFFHPMVWAPRTLRQLLLCAGLVSLAQEVSIGPVTGLGMITIRRLSGSGKSRRISSEMVVITPNRGATSRSMRRSSGRVA